MGQRRLSIDWNIMLEVLKPTGRLYTVAVNPLPADARVVRVIASTMDSNVFELVLESDEWSQVRPGSIIPCIDEPKMYSMDVSPMVRP